MPNPSPLITLGDPPVLPAWRDILEVFVAGTPVPQGSTRAFGGKKGTKAEGKVFTTNDPSGSIERWRGDIRSAVKHAQRESWPTLPLAEPIAMRMSFRLTRPKAHFLPATKSRSRPELRLDAPHWAPSGPDVDKLARAVLDALTGLVYSDDSQVVSIVAAKRYAAPAEGPGLHLELKRAEVTR